VILSLNAEQFLLVYNKVSDNPAPSAQELKNKMDTILLDALSLIEDSKNQTKFSSWIKQEQERITFLNSELKIIKENISDDGLNYPPNKQIE